MIPYSLEGLIIDRLETKIDPTWIVMRSSSLTKTPKQHNHSIYVVPQELAVGHMRRGQVAIEESVLVVTAVRNASTQVTGEGSRSGPMLVVIINALLGWIPDESCQPIEMTNAPSPEFDAGFGLYPLAFKTSYVLNGDLT